MTAFAATLDGNPESELINFVRVIVTNISKQHRKAFFGAAIRYQNEANTTWGVGDNRFGRPAKAKILGQFEQSGVEFSRDWVYAFSGNTVQRDGNILYTFPVSPAPERLMTLKTGYNETQDLTPSKLYVLPTTPVCFVNYPLELDAGEEKTLEFRMPYMAIPQGSSQAGKISSASFDEYLNRTVTFWDELIQKGIDISVPEEKVVNTFKANLVYSLIARNKQDGNYVQKVNDFQYHAFWLRDASFIVRMYDLSGYHDIARQCLDFFPRWQQPDGNFVSQGGQYDGWGQTMWAYGTHFRITHDRQFAESIYPSVRKAVGWLTSARKLDSLHLMPVTTPGDNEDITGHVTGHNFWALAGLKNAIALAEGLGKTEDAASYRAEYNDLKTTLERILRRIGASTGGYIPPGIENKGGQDWGNMLAVYPEMILDPFDPLVTGTLNATRAKYQEGIMTYGNGRYLHHYLTIKNTETELIRGDQTMAMEEFYALLLHTGSTHTGFEFTIFPWGTRDFMMNLTPHGWFSAKFRALMRNMMVREQGDDLHVLSAISPEWFRENGNISVKKASTNFGDVNFALSCGSRKAVLTFDNHFTSAPAAILVHIPWFINIRSADADGVPARADQGVLRLPPGVKKITFQWSRVEGVTRLNYERAVSEYKKEYRRRYQELMTR